MEPMMIMWIAAVVFFLILEGVTYQIVSIWFVIGSVGALIAMLLGADLYIQLAVFAVLSALSLICLRPVTKRIFAVKTERTNADRLIGSEVLVTKDVDNLHQTGEGKAGGTVWTLKSADNSRIAANETAIVERIEGVKLIVRRKGVQV